MAGFVARAGRGENEITKDGSMGLIEESNQYIRTFAESDSWSRAIELAFENGWRRIFALVPGMNVCGGLGDRVRFNEGDIVVVDFARDVSCCSAEAIA